MNQKYLCQKDNETVFCSILTNFPIINKAQRIMYKHTKQKGGGKSFVHTFKSSLEKKENHFYQKKHFNSENHTKHLIH